MTNFCWRIISLYTKMCVISKLKRIYYYYLNNIACILKFCHLRAICQTIRLQKRILYISYPYTSHIYHLIISHSIIYIGWMFFFCFFSVPLFWILPWANARPLHSSSHRPSHAQMCDGKRGVHFSMVNQWFHSIRIEAVFILDFHLI